MPALGGTQKIWVLGHRRDPPLGVFKRSLGPRESTNANFGSIFPLKKAAQVECVSWTGAFFAFGFETQTEGNELFSGEGHTQSL